MTYRRALVVALLVVLAGCGLGGSGGGTDTPDAQTPEPAATPTATPASTATPGATDAPTATPVETPAPTPTERPTPTATPQPTLPPGVTEQGLTDYSALVAAHGDVLARGDVRSRYLQRWEEGGEATHYTNYTLAVDGDGSVSRTFARLVSDSTERPDWARTQSWIENGTVYNRYPHDPGPSYNQDVREVHYAVRSSTTGIDRKAQYWGDFGPLPVYLPLHSYDFTIAERRANAVVLVANHTEPGSLATAGQARVVVTRAGRIVEATGSRRIPTDGDDRYYRNFSYTSTRTSVDLSRPDWTETARQEGYRVTVTHVDGYLRVETVSEARLPADTDINLRFDHEGVGFADTDEIPFEGHYPGTFYVSAVNESGSAYPTVQLTREPPTNVSVPIRSDGTVEFDRHPFVFSFAVAVDGDDDGEVGGSLP